MTDNEITYEIRGAIYDVYKNLGPGLLESVYEEALVYELEKRGLKVDGYFYDSQAVNMKSFIDDYRYYKAKATQISEAKFLEVSACYRDASIQNPYFKDTDKEKVNSYLNSPKTKVPFSMDTDWEKAYDQASKNIKAIIK